MATVKEVNKNIFKKLVEGTDINLDLFPSIRVFLTKEEHDRLASSLHVLSIYVFYRSVCFALAEMEGVNFFVTIGLKDELSSPTLQPVDNKVELCLAVIDRCNIEKVQSATELMLEETVFTSNDIADIKWCVVEGCFPAIQTYKITEEIGATDEERTIYLKRLALFSLCYHKNLLILDFEQDILNTYLNLLNGGNYNIPIDNILHSLGSNYWKFCYVDLYRCVERLYVMSWVHNYKTTLVSGLELHDMYEALHKKFKIEKYESMNLEHLFTLLKSSTNSILGAVSNGMRSDNYIYDLRNKIVHYQKNEAEIESIKESDWNVIVRFLLVAIMELYPIFDSYITALPEE